MDLGTVGVWWSGPWGTSDRAAADPGELEGLGYGALWSSGGFRAGLSARFERLLAATRTARVASGIVSIWKAAPTELGAAVADLDARFPGRFVLGLGVSHAPLIDDYSTPYRHMVDYLDALDRLERPVAPARRVLAALGPRMLELAATRAAGAHPYFVPVEHTARAREILGPGPLLAPEVTVVLERDTTVARERTRAFTPTYLSLPNYANNLRSLGFSEDELAEGGSDRLVDAVVPHGGVDSVAARLREHHEAGADHVAVQVLGSEDEFPMHAYEELASALVSR